jgi:hypothetical protein
MSEFGHQASRDAGWFIDSWGTGPLVLEAKGKSFRFEDSSEFGPSLVNKAGDPMKNPWPSDRSPFWRAHRIWVRQGRRIAEDGRTCIWDEPKPQIVRRIGRRSVVIVQQGDEDGEIVELNPFGDLGE